MRVTVALACGLALIALALALTLSHTPLTLVRKSSPATQTLVSSYQSAQGCQAQETLPRGITAIRVSLTASLGPSVTVKVLSGSRVLTSGSDPPGWAGASVTVPVKPLSYAVSPVKVCFGVTSVNGKVLLRGEPSAPAVAVKSEEGALPGRMNVEYMRPGRSSWWSRISSVARRLGLGRAAAGEWNALLVLVLMLTFITLSSWLVLKELR
jgi:hypothetical protein